MSTCMVLKRARVLLVVGLCALTLACGGGGSGEGAGGGTAPGVPPAPPPASTPGLVATGCGSFQGVVQGGSYALLGIRYAAAPTGSRRWQAPQSAPCPSSVQSVTTFGAKCPQLVPDTSGFVGNEDCLTLNIWSPAASAGKSAARRPVIFFIHGGGNSFGSSSELLASGAATFRGDRLATVANAVVVTINYRIGPLGYLAHPELDAESAMGRSGNYGILDLIAGLRWVRDWIPAFGGDPARVLVFGQSAGGLNTCVLMASPLAAGLMHEAATLSGGCPSRTRAPLDVATQSLAAKAGCSVPSAALGCLRGKTPEQLLRADPPVVELSGVQAAWQPYIDGQVLPVAALAAFNSGTHNRIPVMVSAAADETSRDVSPALPQPQFIARVNALFGAVAPLVLAEYPLAQFGGSPWRTYTQLTTDA